MAFSVVIFFAGRIIGWRILKYARKRAEKMAEERAVKEKNRKEKEIKKEEEPSSGTLRNLGKYLLITLLLIALVILIGLALFTGSFYFNVP